MEYTTGSRSFLLEYDERIYIARSKRSEHAKTNAKTRAEDGMDERDLGRDAQRGICNDLKSSARTITAFQFILLMLHIWLTNTRDSVSRVSRMTRAVE